MVRHAVAGDGVRIAKDLNGKNLKPNKVRLDSMLQQGREVQKNYGALTKQGRRQVYSRIGGRWSLGKICAKWYFDRLKAKPLGCIWS